MEISRIMFALLRAALCGTELDVETKNAITPEILPNLYKLSKMHDLTHLIALGLEKNGLLDTESPIGERYLEIRGMSVFRFEQIRYELEQICALFEENGIRFIPLKGSVIRAYYPEPWMRTSCDIDILVQEESLETATKLLSERLGYENDGKNFHDVSFASPSGVHLELHFCILENQANIDGLLGRVWEYASPVNEGYRYELTAEFLIFYILAHASYHFINGGCGIRPILDLYILEKNLSFDSEKLGQMIESCNLTKFFEAVNALARAWFGGEELPEQYRQIQSYILRGGVYGTLEHKVTVRQAQKGGKRKYLFSRIFMPYEELKVAYPALEKRKWLTPFYQVRRWGSILFGGRIKKSVLELNTSAAVTQEDSDRLKQMMEELELL